MGSIFGGGGGNTTVVENSLPQWIEDAGRGTFNFANMIAGRPLYQYGDSTPADVYGSRSGSTFPGSSGEFGGIISGGNTNFGGGGGGAGGSGGVGAGPGPQLLRSPASPVKSSTSAPSYTSNRTGGKPNTAQVMPAIGGGASTTGGGMTGPARSHSKPNAGRMTMAGRSSGKPMVTGPGPVDPTSPGPTPQPSYTETNPFTFTPQATASFTAPTPQAGTPIGEQRYDRYTPGADVNQQAASEYALQSAGSHVNDMNTSRGYTAQGAGMYGSDDIRRLMNPYIQNALEPAAREIRDQGERNQNAIGDAATRAGSYGGSRMAILEAENNRNTQEAISDLFNRGLSSAYDRATGLRSDEFNRSMSAGGQFADIAGRESDLVSSDIRNLLGTGGTNRDIEGQQRVEDYERFIERRDYPMTQLNTLLAAISGVPYETTQSTTAPGGSSLGNAVGTASSIASLFQLFSDRDAKENIEPYSDQEALESLRGMPISEYNYKPDRQAEVGDDGSKHIGPMAQDYAEATGVGDGTVIPMNDILGRLVGAVRALDEKIETTKLAA